MKKLLFTPMVCLVLVLTTTHLLNAAQSLEDQIKPYGIKMEDLQTALNETSPGAELSEVLTRCANSILSIRTFHSCIVYSKIQSGKNYIVSSNADSEVWKILQVIPKGLLIKNLGSGIIMIEGNFPNTFDGQAFSSKHYLLKYAGTFKYNNTSGSTSTVPKLKLITTLPDNMDFSSYEPPLSFTNLDQEPMKNDPNLN